MSYLFIYFPPRIQRLIHTWRVEFVAIPREAKPKGTQGPIRWRTDLALAATARGQTQARSSKLWKPEREECDRLEKRTEVLGWKCETGQWLRKYLALTRCCVALGSMNCCNHEKSSVLQQVLERAQEFALGGSEDMWSTYPRLEEHWMLLELSFETKN